MTNSSNAPAHTRAQWRRPTFEWCAECGDDWPCSTTEALDALERGGDRG